MCVRERERDTINNSASHADAGRKVDTQIDRYIGIKIGRKKVYRHDHIIDRIQLVTCAASSV